MKKVLGLLLVFSISIGFAGDKNDAAIKYLESKGGEYNGRLFGYKDKRLFSNDDLKYLKDLKGLKSIILTGCNITDEAFVHFQDLKDLEFLRVEKTKINGSGFKYLANLKKLGTIWAHDTNVNDEALKHLANLDGLWELAIGKTRVTDNGLKYLKNMKLKNLSLNNTRVTDKGLKYLYKMETLGYLNLEKTRCTKTGKKNLKKHLPELDVNLGD